MKKAVFGIAIAASLLVMLSASVFSTLVMAAPVPQFGRSSKEDKTRLLTGKVLDSGENPLANAVVYLTTTHRTAPTVFRRFSPASITKYMRSTTTARAAPKRSANLTIARRFTSV